MPSRSRPLLLALGLALALLAGCSSTPASSAARAPGDHVTAAEAKTLADLLHRDFEQGGADFVETAPYGEGTLLKLTGSVDFTRSVGKAQAVTTYSDGRPTEKRTVFFTTKDIWFGDVPHLTEVLTAEKLPAAQYVRRPLAPVSSAGAPQLVDVLAQVVLNLSARSSDDPASFQKGDYTWQGQRVINGKPASVYSLAGGSTVAVSTDKQLLQYVTTLPGQDFAITITLPAHGRRTIDLPTDGETISQAEHPEVLQKLGV
jgi:hypothetical protein